MCWEDVENFWWALFVASISGRISRVHKDDGKLLTSPAVENLTSVSVWVASISDDAGGNVVLACWRTIKSNWLEDYDIGNR